MRPIAAAIRRPGRGKGGPPQLLEIVDLFDQLLGALEQLHKCQIAHLDLNPENICLQLEGNRPRLKVIDLGLSQAEAIPGYLREVAGRNSRTNTFSAPEVLEPKLFLKGVAFSTLAPNRLHATAEPIVTKKIGDTQDPALIPGDEVHFDMGSAGVLSACVETVEDRPESGENRFGFSATIKTGQSPASGKAEVTVFRTLGPAADVYSLGMVLVSLLAQTDNLPGAQLIVRDLALALGQSSASLKRPTGRDLLRRLNGGNSHLASFLALPDRFDEKTRFLAEELMGIALRCLVRGDGYYLKDRSQSTQQGLKELREDFEHVRRAALAVAATAGGEEEMKLLGQPAGPFMPALRLLGQFLRYALPFKLKEEVIQWFLATYPFPVGDLKQPSSPAVQVRLQKWSTTYRRLYERLSAFQVNFAPVYRFVISTNALFLDPLEKCTKKKGVKAVDIELGPDVRGLLNGQEVRKALQVLKDMVLEVDKTDFKQLIRKWQAVLDDWDANTSASQGRVELIRPLQPEPS